MKYWLIKSEPEVFSIDDLAKAKTKQRIGMGSVIIKQEILFGMK